MLRISFASKSTFNKSNTVLEIAFHKTFNLFYDLDGVALWVILCIYRGNKQSKIKDNQIIHINVVESFGFNKCLLFFLNKMIDGYYIFISPL